MKKGQTSNEYIIVFAVVLVMIVIVTTILGDFNIFSSPTSEHNLKAAWLVNNPIGIEYWSSSPNGTFIHFRNNVENIITINTVTLEGREYNLGKTFAKNGIIKTYTGDLNGTGNYEYSFAINYSYKEMDANYIISDEDLPLSGKASHNFVQISDYFELEYLAPPVLASVTSLSNSSKTNGSIYWTWINPGGSFTHAVVYIDDVWKANTSNAYYNATNLTSNTAYTITIHTSNVTYINTTDVNSTITTDETVLPLTWTWYENYTYGTEQELSRYNRTEEVTLGARLDTPILYINFNKASEGTYVQDNSVYNNFGNNSGATWNSSCDVTSVGNDLGGCYEFDGVDDYISTGDILDNYFIGSDAQFTLSAWINRDSGTGRVISKYADSNLGVNQRQFYLEADSSLIFKFHETLNVDDRAYYESTTTSMNMNEWYHVAAVVDMTQANANKVSFYINGINQSISPSFTGDPSNGIADGTAPLTIGADVNAAQSNSYKNFNGSIDQVQIFDRALSASEIQILYNGTVNNTDYYGKYANEGMYTSLVYYNESDIYWNIEQDVATSDTGNHSCEGSLVKCSSGINTNNSDLVSYWPLDESYDDLVGGNDGTCSGTTCPKNATGLSSGAMRFDGVDDGVRVGGYTDFAFTSSDFSISLWSKFEVTDTGGGWEALISKKDRADENNYGWVIAQTNSNLQWKSKSDCHNVFLSNIETDRWYNLQVVYDSSASTILYYVDGELVSTDASCSYLDDTGAYPYLGRWHLTGTIYRAYFQGNLDEVLIYNRLLDASEITEIYKAGLSQHTNTNISIESRSATSYNISDENILGLWGLNSNESNIAIDETGNNDGTFENGANISESSGVVGKGGSFDGIDDYVNLGDVDEIETANEITNCFWVYPKEDSDGYIYSDGAGTNSILFLRDDVGSLTSRINIFTLVVTGASGGARLETSNNSAPINAWTHVCFNFKDEQTDGLNIYINGQLDSQTTPNEDTIALGSISNSDSIYIGQNNALSSPFEGSIDEIRIYNRTLTQSEIQDLYELGSHHIEWNDWSDEVNVVDSETITTTQSGKFMQFKNIFQTSNTEISPYLLKHRIDIGN